MAGKTSDQSSQHRKTVLNDDTGMTVIHPHYQIYNAICADATGVLYRGKSIVDDRLVAIKWFTEAATPASLADYNGELHLTNLVNVRDVLLGNNGVPFAVMDMPGGAALEKLLSKKGTLPIAAAVHIALNVSLTVRAIHMHQETHGHVNAQNVFLNRQSNGRIGVHLLYCKMKGKPADFNQPGYLSPELIGGNDMLQPSDDIWAISVLLYQMIFGAAPFSGNIRDETVRRVLSEALTLPQSFEEHYGTLASFFRKSLSRDLNERLDGREMNLVLKSILSELRRKRVSEAPVGMAPNADSVETESQETPRSVPAESFIEEELRETRPAKVIRTGEGETDFASVTDETGLGLVSQSVIPEDMRDTSPGVYTVQDAERTPAQEILPVADADIVERVARKTAPSQMMNDAPSAHKQAIVVAEVEEIESISPHMDFVSLSSRPVTGAAAQKRIQLVLMILAASVLIGISFAIASYFFSSSSSRERGAPAYGKSTSETEPTDRPNPTRDAASTIAPPKRPKAAAAAEVEEVVIALKGLPPDARVTVNGMNRELPLVLPKSSEPVAVQAIVGNRIVFAETFAPTENQSFYVAGGMNKTKKSSRRKRRATRENKDGASSRTTTGTLSSNPHQLRGNPFATGAKE